jgi:hypothetical protein
MGLADRDYMKERREAERPFAPPPEPAWRITLRHLLWWIAIAYLCFKAVSWWQANRTSPVLPKPAPPVAESASAHESTKSGSIQVPTGGTAPTAPRLRADSGYTASQSSTIAVRRCVLEGRILLTDGECAAGTLRSSVTVHGPPNIADAPQFPLAPLQTAGASSAGQAPYTSAPQPPQVDVAQAQVGQRAACEYHAAAIRAIDARARQAISAWEQDELAARRKKHRDEESRLRC